MSLPLGEEGRRKEFNSQLFCCRQSHYVQEMLFQIHLCLKEKAIHHPAYLVIMVQLI